MRTRTLIISNKKRLESMIDGKVSELIIFFAFTA